MLPIAQQLVGAVRPPPPGSTWTATLNGHGCCRQRIIHTPQLYTSTAGQHYTNQLSIVGTASVAPFVGPDDALSPLRWMSTHLHRCRTTQGSLADSFLLLSQYPLSTLAIEIPKHFLIRTYLPVLVKWLFNDLIRLGPWFE